MSSVTNPIIDAVAAYFAEDASAFSEHKFAKALANGEGYGSAGQLAIDFLDSESLGLAEKMDAPYSVDGWGLARLLNDIVQAWPMEWMEPLGEKLAGIFAS